MNIKEKKILLLQEHIVSYRLPVFNLIAEKVNLTIAFTKKNDTTIKDNFKTIKLNKITIGGFHFIKNNFFKFCKKYDVVIVMTDLHYISYCLLPFLKRDYKERYTFTKDSKRIDLKNVLINYVENEDF